MNRRRPVHPSQMTHDELVDEVLELRDALEWRRYMNPTKKMTRVYWWAPHWAVTTPYAVKWYGPGAYGWALRFARKKVDQGCMVRIEQAPIGRFSRKEEW